VGTFGGPGVPPIAQEVILFHAFSATLAAHRVNVRMIRRGSGAGLAAEAFKHARVLNYVGGDELECHESPKFRVLGLVHRTHTTAAKLLTMPEMVCLS
jgi:hypothetical protein